jgi:hypothetical protein
MMDGCANVPEMIGGSVDGSKVAVQANAVEDGEVSAMSRDTQTNTPESWVFVAVVVRSDEGVCGGSVSALAIVWVR